MLVFTYCADSDDSVRLRESAFQAHLAHVSADVDKMRLGFPLAVEDVESVEGNDKVVSSLLCYDVPTLAQGIAQMRTDPYFLGGAWERLEFYTAPNLPPPDGPGSAQTGQRYYAALLRRDAGEGFDAQALAGTAAALGQAHVMSTILNCAGLSCRAAADVTAFCALVFLSAPDMASARDTLQQASPQTVGGDGWTLLYIPRVSGTWKNLMPGAAPGQIKAPPKG